MKNPMLLCSLILISTINLSKAADPKAGQDASFSKADMALLNAIREGSLKKVKKIFKEPKIAFKKQPQPNVNITIEGETLLTLAINIMLEWSPDFYEQKSPSFEAIIELLIKKGANVNTFNHSNETPLMKATLTNSPKLIMILLDNKADIEATNNRGDTALLLAAAHPTITVKTVEILLSQGANPNIFNKDGISPLLKTVRANRPLAVVESLLKSGASVHTKGPMGLAALIVIKEEASRNHHEWSHYIKLMEKYDAIK
jgi:hypothetical protein